MRTASTGTVRGSLLLTCLLVVACTSTASTGSPPATGEGADSTEAAQPAAATATTPPLQNTLRWKTASEVENFGFDIYRSTAEDGPFERLTAQPVAGAGTSDEITEYAFVDDTIEAGTAYWYYVESISMSGERERFTPVFRAPPRFPTPDAEDTDDTDG